jgi:aminoglycoside phosphotransferase (APT) family kinase protein
LIALARAEGFEAELETAEFKLGWENVVLDTVDGWILRFPRDEDATGFERELLLLDRLHDRLPAPIPKIIHVSRTAPYAAYRRLNGVHLDAARFEAAEPRVKDRIAGDLGRFLAVMHQALTPDEITTIGVPLREAGGSASVEAALPAEVRAVYRNLSEEFDRRLAAGSGAAVLLHDDFHLGNLVLDADLGRLAGVWDFSCVSVGDPSLDFRYLVGDSAELAARIASAYAARTGREIDLGLAAMALTLEDVSDALEEHRDPAPYLR